MVPLDIYVSHDTTTTTCTHLLIQAGYPHDDRGIPVQVHAHLFPENDGAGYNQGCYREQSQRMHQRIEAFEHAYQHVPLSEQRVQENLLSSDRPRYLSAIDDGVAVPWSSWIANQHANRDQLVGELLYEPAAELAAWEPLHPSLAFDVNPAEEPSSDGPVKTDASSDEAMPEDNIDPPRSPDPVGPPAEPVCGYTCYVGKAPRRKMCGGRNGPLNRETRENAKTNRQKGACWSCILQRNKVRSISKAKDITQRCFRLTQARSADLNMKMMRCA